MTHEFLFDVLKKQSDRHLNSFKKENANFLKLLKKVRRQYMTKYKKGLISKDAIIKIIDKAQKYVDDLENDRNTRLKELVDQFILLKNAKKMDCNVCISDFRNSANNNNLVPVYEETDSLTNLNKTITAANDIHQETITEIEDTIMLHDIDATFEEMDVVNDNLNVTIVESSIFDERQLQVTLENIAHQPIDEIEEEIPIENDKMEFEQINLEKFDLTAVETDSEKSSSAERLNSLHNKSSIDETIFDRAIVQNKPLNTSSNFNKMFDTGSVSKTQSLDSSINISNKLSSVNQADRNTSLSSTKTPGLFKSKYYLNCGSNQKLAQKPQIKTNSILKKKTDDVHNKKKQIEEERQRKLKDNELRQEKIAGLKNICATVKPVNHHVKVITKAAAPLVREMTRTEPRVVHTKPLLKPQSSNKPMVVQSSIKSLQQKQSVSTAPKPLTSTLKPINKPIITKSSISQAAAPINAEFKTPVALKTKPVLSESCRRIVVNHATYCLDGLLSDNSDDDEENVGQIVPIWADKQSGTLGRLSQYHTENTDPTKVFYPASLLLQQMTSSHVFAKYEHKPKKRTSSAVWK